MVPSRVKCVFRLVSNGEVYPAMFSFDTGKIVGFEEFMSDKCSKVIETVKYNPYNYESSYIVENELSYKDLYDALFINRDALVAIEFNNIGAVLVSDEIATKNLKYTGWGMTHILDKSEDRIFNVNPVIYAVLKAPVYTLESTQRVMHAVQFKYSNTNYLMTRWGLIESGEIYLQPSLEGYKAMFNERLLSNLDIYATGVDSNGNVKYVTVNSNKKVEVIDYDN